MHELTLGRIAEFTGGRCLPEHENIVITDICRDSRACHEGSLFVPLPGARFDGHDFIESAKSFGASAVIASKEGEWGLPAVYVRDTLEGYQAIAAGYKAGFTKLKTVGITGSAGKTTTTKMTACVLSTLYRLHTTQEDNNGQRGLPASLLELDESAEAAVLEMGMSMPGELHRLSVMARPDAAVINGIGRAHIEFFGTRENILKAKLEIVDGMDENGVLILNGDDDLLWAKRGSFAQKTVYYGIKNRECDILGDVLSMDAHSCSFRVTAEGGSAMAALPASGEHNVLDALAAVGVGLCFGVELSAACKALARYIPARGRENVYRRDGITVIDDCYNASPEAVKASVGVLSALDAGKRIACLGDMLELGEQTDALHFECGAFAADKIDFLVACGSAAKFYAKGAVSAGMDKAKTAYFESREDAAAFLRSIAREGDAILFKGSHGAHVELVLSAFFDSEKV